MSARPTTSLSQGSILVDFTANTTNDSNASQRPNLVINYTTGGTPSNPAPSITSFSPDNPTPSYALNSTTLFNVTTDQPVSSTWYLNGANQNNNTQARSHTWDTEGQYNVTYVGANGNGSVSIMWIISIIPDSIYDVNQDGLVDETDRNIVWNSIKTGIYCERCDINNNTEVEVFDWVMVSGNSV